MICPRLGHEEIPETLCEHCFYFDDENRACLYRDLYNPRGFNRKE
jgi:hypothetical protein